MRFHLLFSRRPKRPRRSYRPQRTAPWGLCPLAARLLLAGLLLILLALCDFAIRLDISEAAGETGAILLMEDIGGSLSASGVLLCAAVLGLEYLERTHPRKPPS